MKKWKESFITSKKILMAFLLCFSVIGSCLFSVNAENADTVTVHSFDTATYQEYLNDQEKKDNFYKTKDIAIVNDKVTIPVVGGGDYSVNKVKINTTESTQDATWNYVDTLHTKISVDVKGYSNIESIDVFYEAKDLDNYTSAVTFYDYSVIGETDKVVNLNSGATMTFTYNGVTYNNVHVKSNIYSSNPTNSNYSEILYNDNNNTGLEFQGGETLTDFKYQINDESESKVYEEVKISFPGFGYWDQMNVTLIGDKTESCLNAGVNQYENSLTFGQTGLTDKMVTRTSAWGNEVNINVNNAANTTDPKDSIIRELFDEMRSDDPDTLYDPGFFDDSVQDWKTIYNDYKLNFYRNGHEYELHSSINTDKQNERIAFDRDDRENAKNNYGVRKDFFPLNDQEWNDTYEKVASLGYSGGALTNHTSAPTGDNCFFGMKYDFNFTIGDYRGPMEFRFAGDDDLWVVLDDKVILDLGGLHQAYPQAYSENYQDMVSQVKWYADIWKALADKYGVNDILDDLDDIQLNEVLNQEHKISVYYMERGGWDSSCYMRFILPNAHPDVPNTGNIQFTKVDAADYSEKLSGAQFGLFKSDDTQISSSVSDENGIVKFNNVDPGNYYVKEITAPNDYQLSNTKYPVTVEKDQTATISNVEGKNGIITNTKEEAPHKGSLTIKKTSEGHETPSNTVFTIVGQNYSDSIQYDKFVNNQYTFENLSLGEYTVTESNASVENYTLKVTVNGTEVTDGKGTVNVENNSNETIEFKNTYEPETTQMTVTKNWDDNENRNHLRPASITVKLLKNGNETGQTITLNASNNWTNKFENLPKFDDNGLITYSVKEVNHLNDYLDPTYASSDQGFTVTNTLNPDKEKVTIPVGKVWDDDNDRDGIRPKEITVKLLKNGNETGQTITLNASNDWTNKFENLSKFDDNGNEIKYTIDEESVEGYDKDINGYNITNTHSPKKTEINVSKVWDDNENKGNTRPDSITAYLLANGKDTGKTITLNAANGWQGSFTDLYVKENGQDIDYTVKEIKVDQYNDGMITGNSNVGFTITNKLTPKTEKISIPVEKVWEDSDNQDGIRPEKITVNLLVNNKVIANIELSEANKWKSSFNNLDKYSKNNEEIKYKIEEVSVEGYQSTIAKKGDGYVITNIHQPDLINISGIKTWKNVPEGTKYPTVTIELYQDGTKIDETQIKNGGKEYSFNELTKYGADGHEYVYTVKEVAIDGYESEQNGTDFINTYIPTTPHNPDTPITPDQPDKPDVPDTPDIPVTPDQPNVPSIPNTPDQPLKDETVNVKEVKEEKEVKEQEKTEQVVKTSDDESLMSYVGLSFVSLMFIIFLVKKRNMKKSS